DELLGRQVAVKLLHHHFAADQEFVERFRREASSAAGLSHTNIVAIFDRGSWEDTYYIAMEYVAGRSLKEIVREQVQAIERDLIVRGLEVTGGNVTRTARLLKISRKSLQMKMKDFGLREEEA
ncbi:MAG TPA: helix-turn-helix domain-containing protein, partial [Myxococcales bacterium]|nr:helix-turn-helix domain-containing protein [Myxococcales bacterium]